MERDGPIYAAMALAAAVTAEWILLHHWRKHLDPANPTEVHSRPSTPRDAD